MKLLITIRGNSCSGKTTLAKELQKRFGRGTMRLSQDVIRREILHVKDEPNPKSIPFMKLMLEYGHENAEIVIPAVFGEGGLFDQHGYYRGWVTIDGATAAEAAMMWQSNFFDMDMVTVTIDSGLSEADQ